MWSRCVRPLPSLSRLDYACCAQLAEAIPVEGSGITLPLDLHRIAARCRNSYFAPKRFSAVQLAYSEPRCRVLVFRESRFLTHSHKPHDWHDITRAFVCVQIPDEWLEQVPKSVPTPLSAWSGVGSAIAPCFKAPLPTSKANCYRLWWSGSRTSCSPTCTTPALHRRRRAH